VFKLDIKRILLKSSRNIQQLEKHAHTLFFLVAAGVTLFLTAGGLYTLIENPVALLPLQDGGWTFLYTGSITHQTASETIVAGISYLIGVLGLFLLYRSTRRIYRPKQAYLTFVVGVVLTFIGLAYTLILLQSKLY
jgi:hypothetical protein